MPLLLPRSLNPNDIRSLSLSKNKKSTNSNTILKNTNLQKIKIKKNYTYRSSEKWDSHFSARVRVWWDQNRPKTTNQKRDGAPIPPKPQPCFRKMENETQLGAPTAQIWTERVSTAPLSDAVNVAQSLVGRGSVVVFVGDKQVGVWTPTYALMGNRTAGMELGQLTAISGR